MHLNFPHALAIALLAGSAWIGGSAFAQVRQVTTGQAVTANDQQAVTTQTGDSTSFAIQRDTTESVAAASTNFLSQSSAPGTSGTSFGTVAGFGSLSGGSRSSSGLGGLSTLGGGRGGLGSNQFGGNQFGSNQFGGLQTGQQGVAGSLQLRHRVRVDIESSPRAITRISREFAQRLTRLPGLKGLKGVDSVDIAMAGRTVVLTGSVDSARTRDLVARLAMLEPGVAAVQNELLVTPTEAAPDSLQPPAR